MPHSRRGRHARGHLSHIIARRRNPDNDLCDSVRLKVGAEELKSIVRANSQIVRVLAGHHHRSIDCLWGGTLVSIAPAVVNALDLELGPARAFRVIAEPPAFRLHVRKAGQELVSHLLHVEQFGEPFEALPDPGYPAMTSFLRDVSPRTAAISPHPARTAQ